MKWLLDKFFPVKIWGISASDANKERGMCYTLIAGRFIFMAMPVGHAYEKDRSGNPTEGFDKIIIL